jgi:hypothetical protein
LCRWGADAGGKCSHWAVAHGEAEPKVPFGRSEGKLMFLTSIQEQIGAQSLQSLEWCCGNTGIVFKCGTVLFFMKICLHVRRAPCSASCSSSSCRVFKRVTSRAVFLQFRRNVRILFRLDEFASICGASIGGKAERRNRSHEVPQQLAQLETINSELYRKLVTA